MSNPSVPRHRLSPPRPLRDDERATLLAAADLLIPDAPGRQGAGHAPDYARWLDCALAARSDAFEVIVGVAERLRGMDRSAMLLELRVLSEAEAVVFHAVSSILAGAYLMVPSVREAINYPGQERKPAPFDEAAEQIMNGILDPVIERGPIYLSIEPGGLT